MKFLILSATFLISLYSKANFIDYYNHINEGEYQMYQGNYDLAIANFLIGFEQVETPHARDLYFTAKCYAQLQNDEQFYSYLKQARNNGLRLYRLEVDSLWFTMYWAEPEFKAILQSNNDYLKPRIDSTYLGQLNSIWVTYNQFSSDEEDSVKTYFDTTSFDYQEYFKLKQKNYDSNKRNFIKLILNNNLPNLINDNFELYNNRGMKPSKVIRQLFMLYFQPDLPEYNQIKNKLLKGLKEGLISPIQYASIIEYSLIFSGQNILYGLNISSINDSNLNSILENRRKIGLSIYYDVAPSYSNYYGANDITNNFKTE